jgi:hypothetical protein
VTSLAPVRGLLKGSIALLMVALVCAAMAPGAGAVQVPPEESEGIYLEVTPRKDARVTVQVHPQLGFAIVWAEMGISWRGKFQQPHGAVK